MGGINMEIVKFEKENVLQFKDLAEGDVFSDSLDPNIIMLKIKEKYKTFINAVDLHTGQTYKVSRDCNVNKYPNARVVLD